MGLYDRGYYQDSYSGPAPAQGPRTAVTILIMINVAIFILDQFTPVTLANGNLKHHWLSDQMAVSSKIFAEPWTCWKLLTAGFAHSPLDSNRFIWHIFANMFGLFIFGRSLEALYGKEEFLRLYMTLLVLSLFTWVVFQYANGNTEGRVLGASGAVSGLVVLYAMRFPHNKLMLIPFPALIPAWVVGVLLVSSDIMGAIRQPGSGVAYTCHLAGAGLAAIYQLTGTHLGDVFPFSMKWRLPKRGPKLRVHRPRERADEQLAAKADKILQKVHEHGEQSITASERRVLNEYSRRVRRRNSER